MLVGNDCFGLKSFQISSQFSPALSAICLKMRTVDAAFGLGFCYSFYPIDLHDAHGVKPEELKSGTFPTIPRGALIPKGSKNMMVAGRCLSSDRLANSAARVQASCMAMGQAAPQHWPLCGYYPVRRAVE